MAEDTTTTTTTDPAWHAGITDAELVGHIQTKGWHSMTAVEAASAAAKSHREAERMLGAKSTHDVMLVPKDPNSPDWAGVYEKFGQPKDAKGYDLAGVKFTDGTALDEKFVDLIRDTAFKNHVPAAVAPEFAKAVVKFMEDADKAEQADTTAALAVEQDKLAKNWGNNTAQNKLVAQAAVRALGLDPAVVATLESVVGYSAVMEMFRNIGARLGEDRYITNENGRGANGVMTREQAVARKAELMKDGDWTKKYMAGSVEHSREMTSLNTIITSGQTHF